jgi:hypothetical protein
MRAYIIAGALAVCASSLHAGPRGPTTPRPGSAERTAILDALREDVTYPYPIKFRVDTLRMFRSKKGAIAYVIAEPAQREFDAGTYFLTQSGTAPWKQVWADTGGGSDSCAQGALHYAWAMELIRSYGIAPDALVPGITAQTKSFATQAKSDPDLHCTGDLEGGPERL